MNVLFWGQRAEGNAWQSSLRRPKVWGEQSWCERRKEKSRPHFPPQMITYSNAVGTAGLSQQHLTGPGRGRSPRQTTLHPNLHPTGVYSQQTLFGVQTHQVPAQRTSLSICQVGWGRARSVKPKTRPSRGSPDQARPVPRGCDLPPAIPHSWVWPKGFSPRKANFH